MEPWRTWSAMVSNTRYGLIADAPYPISRQKWWASRGSPDSRTRPTRPRVPLRTRWWCTADTARRAWRGVVCAGRHGEQGRDRGVDLVVAAVREDHLVVALGDGLRCLATEVLDRP